MFSMHYRCKVTYSLISECCTRAKSLVPLQPLKESAVGLALDAHLDANIIDKPTSRRGLHSFFNGHVESENLQFCYSQPQSAHRRVTTVWLEFQRPLITDWDHNVRNVGLIIVIQHGINFFAGAEHSNSHSRSEQKSTHTKWTFCYLNS